MVLRLERNKGGSSGSAYIFELQNEAWQQTSKLVPADGASGDYFGSSVDISQGQAIVGAYGDVDQGSSPGSAYIYSQDGASWSQSAKLIGNDGNSSDLLGYSVGISGNNAIASAYGNEYGGAAYLFKNTSGAWTETSKIQSSDLSTGDAFGRSVSTDGNFVMVGAGSDDDKGSSSGSAYIFTF